MMLMTPAKRVWGETLRRVSAAPDTAMFAGGCFWSMQKAFDGTTGVIKVTAGYAGGHTANPTYEQVESGGTGHAESVQVVFDPAVISYERLVTLYWHNIDPLDAGGAFCDRGAQYRSVVFYRDSTQRRIAERSKEAVARHFAKSVVTQIVASTPFYPAEEYHQYYYRKNPVQYHAYRIGCGKDRRIEALWGAQAGRE
jgi:peptide-methionine (S)-S-oxide reductase